MGNHQSRKTQETDQLRTNTDIIRSIDNLIQDSKVIQVIPEEVQNDIEKYANQAKMQLQRAETAKQLTKTDYIRIYSLLLRAFKPTERRDCSYLNETYTVSELTQQIRFLIYDPCIVPIVAGDFVPALLNTSDASGTTTTKDIFDI